MRRLPAFSWIDGFEVTVFSCDHHLVKPNRRFTACAWTFSEGARRSAFSWTMSPVNVEGGRAAGMASLLFRSAEDAGSGPVAYVGSACQKSHRRGKSPFLDFLEEKFSDYIDIFITISYTLYCDLIHYSERLMETRQQARPIDEVITKYPKSREQLISILQEVQAEYGYLSRESIKRISDYLGLPSSKIFGVATFYNQFKMNAPGRIQVAMCRGTACHVKGSLNLLDTCRQLLGIEVGADHEGRALSPWRPWPASVAARSPRP